MVGSANQRVPPVPCDETTVLIGSHRYHSFPIFALPVCCHVWEQKYIWAWSWLKPDGLDLWSFSSLDTSSYKNPLTPNFRLKMHWLLWKYILCVTSKLHGRAPNPLLCLVWLACCCIVGTCYMFVSLTRGGPSKERQTLSLPHGKTCVSLFQWDFDCRCGQSLSAPMLAALSRWGPALRWTLSPRASALSLSRSAASSQRIAATRLHVLQTPTALFHRSEARAGPDPHKATSGKEPARLPACL